MKNFLKNLVQTDTTVEKGELEAAKIIADQFAQSDIDFKIDTWDQTRANIIAHIKSTGPKKALLFLCHLDVVPPGDEKWQNPPFSALELDSKILGRGSADMKAGIVAIVTAIRQLVDSGTNLKGDIILAATAGEETDSCGAKKFVEKYKDKLPALTGIVIPEPTDFEVVTAHQGILWLQVKTKGKTAHGSTPQLGVNAITSMKLLLDKFADYKLSDGCSMSINKIQGGKAVNVVPDRCSVEIDIRTNFEQSHQMIVDDFEKMFIELKNKNPEFQAILSIIKQVKALQTNTDCNFVKQFCSAVEINETRSVVFCTDGPFLEPLNAPVVIFGPGIPSLCHKPDEYIDIPDIERAIEYYKNIILRFLT